MDWKGVNEAIVNGDLDLVLDFLKPALDSPRTSSNPLLDPIWDNPPPPPPLPLDSAILCRLVDHPMNYWNANDTFRIFVTLLNLGCDPTTRDERTGQSVLHILTRKCLESHFTLFANMLIRFVEESERTSYVNAKDLVGNPAFVYAVDYGRVRRLLCLGGDPDVQDEFGQTALHRLCKRINLEPKWEKVRLLLQHRCDPTILDDKGYMPIAYLSNPYAFDGTAAFLLLQNMMGWHVTTNEPART